MQTKICEIKWLKYRRIERKINLVGTSTTETGIWSNNRKLVDNYDLQTVSTKKFGKTCFYQQLSKINKRKIVS